MNALMDQLLLALARAVGISDTYLSSIVIVEGDGTDFLADEEMEEEETVVTIFPKISDLYEDEQESNDSSPDVESLPISIEGIRTVRLHVKVRANDYEGLARFTEEIDLGSFDEY